MPNLRTKFEESEYYYTLTCFNYESLYALNDTSTSWYAHIWFQFGKWHITESAHMNVTYEI